MVQHLACTERYWFHDIAAGLPADYPFDGDDPDADWRVEPDRPADAVFRLYRDQCAKSNALLASMPLTSPPRRREDDWPADDVPDLRWIALHMIEETARHAGHLDVVRELLDGRTGLGPR